MEASGKLHGKVCLWREWICIDTNYHWSMPWSLFMPLTAITPLSRADSSSFKRKRLDVVLATSHGTSESREVPLPNHDGSNIMPLLSLAPPLPHTDVVTSASPALLHPLRTGSGRKRKGQAIMFCKPIKSKSPSADDGLTLLSYIGSVLP